MSCCICKNDYTTTHICASCRRDPANADWVRSVDGETSEAEVEHIVERWQPDDTDIAIARALFDRKSLRQTASEVGCTVARVRAFKASVMVAGNSVRTVRAAPLGASPACVHEWEERSDLGMGAYACVLCGIPGRRSVQRGTITPRVRHVGYRKPPLTVAFKPLAEQPDSDVDGRAPLKRLHSNRHEQIYNDDEAIPDWVE